MNSLTSAVAKCGQASLVLLKNVFEIMKGCIQTTTGIIGNSELGSIHNRSCYIIKMYWHCFKRVKKSFCNVDCF